MKRYVIAAAVGALLSFAAAADAQQVYRVIIEVPEGRAVLIQPLPPPPMPPPPSFPPYAAPSYYQPKFCPPPSYYPAAPPVVAETRKKEVTRYYPLPPPGPAYRPAIAATPRGG
jgi:hypothetical protein